MEFVASPSGYDQCLAEDKNVVCRSPLDALPRPAFSTDYRSFQNQMRDAMKV